MIPLNLTLKGIYSYREKQSIDFTRLTEANIFGIFGAVGSGKSTILEAISFALYGETERLHGRDNRWYNMMNLKSDEFLIDFIFKVGGDGTEYRFIINGTRNRRKFDDVPRYDRRAFKRINEQWDPIETKTAEEIIGLSYENFRRTIIIPQNRFQEFLQLGDTERTRMLKELFDLERFELSDKVKLLEGKNEEVRIGLESRLDQIGEIKQEEIKEKESRLQQLIELIKSGDKTLGEKRNTEKGCSSLKEVFKKIAEQENTVKTLKLQEPEFKRLKTQVMEYEKCHLNFENILDKKKDFEKQIREQSAEIEELKNHQADTQEKLKNKMAVFKSTKADYENKEQLRARSDELAKVIQMTESESKERKLSDKVKEYNDALSNITKTLQEKTEEQKSNKKNLTDLKKKVPDLSSLADIRAWFADKNKFLKSVVELKEDQDETEGKIKELSGEQKRLLTLPIKRLLADLPEDADIKAIIAELKQKKSVLEKKKEGIEEERRHLAAQHELEEYAKALKDGDACPLCGSKKHPALLSITDVNKAIKKAETDKKDCQGKIDLIDEAVEGLNNISSQFGVQATQMDKIKEKLKKEEESLKKHLAAFKWKDFSKDDERPVNKAFADAEKQNKEIKNLEKELDTLSESIEEANREKDKITKDLNNLRSEQAGISSTIKTLCSQVRILNYDDYKGKKPEVLKNEIDRLNKQSQEIEKSYKQLEKQIQELKDKESQVKGNLEKSLKTVEADRSSLLKVKETITNQLEKSGYSSIEAVEAILNINLDLESEKTKIEEFGKKLHAANEQFNTLAKEAEGKNYDEKAHNVLIGEIEKIGKELDEKKGERGRLSNEIGTLNKNLSDSKDLRVKLDSVKLRGEDIAILKGLFKSSGFVNYVSSMYIQNLCNAANERFYKLTKQKLKLEVTEDNDFQIRDFMHDGQVRSVKTLSGGQTFQAALSMALALADSIQTGSNENFFFLDEGFGSLDKESLQIVFDTLKTLRKESRIVGVISHVEEMQQEIDTYLKITNDEEKGSVIDTSWDSKV